MEQSLSVHVCEQTGCCCPSHVRSWLALDRDCQNLLVLKLASCIEQKPQRTKEKAHPPQARLQREPCSERHPGAATLAQRHQRAAYLGRHQVRAMELRGYAASWSSCPCSKASTSSPPLG
eukprot:1156072-Pelagomonas_calceolata.AAC.1